MSKIARSPRLDAPEIQALHEFAALTGLTAKQALEFMVRRMTPLASLSRAATSPRAADPYAATRIQLEKALDRFQKLLAVTSKAP